jgi:hypothetical protein
MLVLAECLMFYGLHLVRSFEHIACVCICVCTCVLVC